MLSDLLGVSIGRRYAGALVVLGDLLGVSIGRRYAGALVVLSDLRATTQQTVGVLRDDARVHNQFIMPLLQLPDQVLRGHALYVRVYVLFVLGHLLLQLAV